MSEMTTQGGTSGEAEAGGTPVPSGDSGTPATGASTADSFAAERAQLETQRREQQGRADRLEAELRALKATPTPAPPATPVGEFLTRDDFRSELRRQRELDSAVGALREQFPFAADVLSNVDSFDSVEQLKVAAENAHKRVEGQIAPAVQAAVDAAIQPYVAKYGAIQTAPAGAQPGEGLGLPTLADLERMSLAEQDALEAAHPGHIARLHREAFST